MPLTSASYMRGLLRVSTDPQPDQVDGCADAKEQPPEKKEVGLEPVVQGPADTTPEEQAGQEIANDRPGSAIVIWFH